jgi:hypothetical protein
MPKPLTNKERKELILNNNGEVSHIDAFSSYSNSLSQAEEEFMLKQMNTFNDSKAVESGQMLEGEFMEKWGESTTAYRMKNDPQYKAQVEQKLRTPSQQGSIDLPRTDLRRNDVIDPNTMWQYPQLDTKNARAMSDFSNKLIASAMPIPLIDDINYIGKARKFKPKSVNIFKVTDIDKARWGKWNKEIPKNKELLEEYRLIEQNAKEKGTWMKNADGTFFEGTPEQFVQQQSVNFKKAFPEGFGKTYRGDRRHYEKLRPFEHSFYGDRSVFTGSESMASEYTFPKYSYYNRNIPTASEQIVTNTVSKDLDNIITISDEGGMHELYYPKSKNSRRVDAANRGWTNIKDEKIYNEMSDKVKKGNFDNEFSTDDLAWHAEDKGIDYIIVDNVVDGSARPDRVMINRQAPGNYLKSMWGNNGMFDMQNSNIYKAIFPPIVGGVAATKLNNKKTN